MNSEERKQKIDSLQSEIDRLIEEDRNEIRDGILPFFKQHCSAEYNGSGTTLTVKCDSDDSKETLLKLMDAVELGWSYHFGCPLNEVFDISFDDGNITIHINIEKTDVFNGPWNNITTHEVLIRELKKLGIPVSFHEYLSDINIQIDRLKKELDKVNTWNQELNGD